MIDDIMELHNIKTLFHFTNVKNLDSILNNGLLSIDLLEKNKIEYCCNEHFRLDGYKDRICVSIGYPSYRSFYKYRTRNKGKWCVISLKADLLKDKDCLYCIKESSSNEEILKEERLKKGDRALNNLYYEVTPTRLERGLNLQYTTNPDSEVLVKDKIEVDYFNEIYFNDRAIFESYKNKSRKIFMIYEDWVFKRRKDWEFN